jgi:hypothetical protein
MAWYSRTVSALAFCVAFAPVVAAQWPSYPTPDVPRKDGKPILDAPAPRMPDGKVDFSGIWHGEPLAAEPQRRRRRSRPGSMPCRGSEKLPAAALRCRCSHGRRS